MAYEHTKREGKDPQKKKKLLVRETDKSSDKFRFNNPIGIDQVSYYYADVSGTTANSKQSRLLRADKCVAAYHNMSKIKEILESVDIDISFQKEPDKYIHLGEGSEKSYKLSSCPHKKAIYQRFEFEGMKTNMYTGPKPTVRIGRTLVNAAFNRQFMTYWNNIFLTEIPLCNAPDTYKAWEENNRKKMGFISQGIRVPGGLINNSLKTTNTNLDFQFPPHVIKGYIAYLRSLDKKGDFVKTIDGHMILGSSSGYPFRSKGIDMTTNSMAVFLSVQMGSEIKRTKSWKSADYIADLLQKKGLPFDSFAAVESIRLSNSKKVQLLPVITSSGVQIIGTGGNQIPNSRSIFIVNKVETAIVKEEITQLHQILLKKTRWHVSDVRQAQKDLNKHRQTYGKKPTYYLKAKDFNKYDTSIIEAHIQPFYDEWFKDNPVVLEAIRRGASHDVVSSPCVQGSYYTASTFGYDYLLSGKPDTSVTGNVVHDLLLCYGHDLAHGNIEFWENPENCIFVQSDDCIYASTDLKFMESMKVAAANSGMSQEEEDIPAYLSTYLGETFMTNSVCKLLANFFSPENVKDADEVVVVSVAAHYDLLKDSPLFSLWERCMNDYLIQTGYLPFNSIKEIKNYSESTEFQAKLIAYGEKSGNNKKTLRDVLSGLTQGNNTERQDVKMISTLLSMNLVDMELNVKDFKLSNYNVDYYRSVYVECMFGSVSAMNKLKSFYAANAHLYKKEKTEFDENQFDDE